MVYKPSEVTPLHGQELAQLFTQAGLPKGVFNIVNGDGAVGSCLASHKGIAKVSFTGQVSTGQKVAAAAAEGMKYVTMELGGKSALIVLEDADLESAADGAMMASLYSTGQVCTNGTRVFVPCSMKTAFERRLAEKMRFVRHGNIMDPTTNFGPLVSETHHQKVTRYIMHGIKVDKATLLAGGPGTPENIPKGCENGFWIRPTVFTDCNDNMLITREEIFGPVMCILTYNTVPEVITRANSSPLGLAAGIFTRDLNAAHKVISQLEAGITWVNTWGESPAEMSVGGWKMSGLGVENGRKGLEAWVREKSTLVEMAGSIETVFRPTDVVGNSHL
jgi:betaine-aldehyde dehydrogenase